MIDVPRTSKYQLIFHYLLSRYAPVTALVKFIPTLDSGKILSFEISCRPRASGVIIIARNYRRPKGFEGRVGGGLHHPIKMP